MSDAHQPECECSGMGLIPVDQTDGHGVTYLAWKRCPGRATLLIRSNLGPSLSFYEFVHRHPDWKEKFR